MPTRQNVKHIASLVLAWFVLSLASAVAAPLMQSNDFVMVCSSTGMVQLMQDSNDGSEPGTTSRSSGKLKCPLCMVMDAPPDLQGSSQQALHFPSESALIQDRSNAITTSACATPLPARGPPANTLT